MTHGNVAETRVQSHDVSFQGCLDVMHPTAFNQFISGCIYYKVIKYHLLCVWGIIKIWKDIKYQSAEVFKLFWICNQLHSSNA